MTNNNNQAATLKTNKGNSRTAKAILKRCIRTNRTLMLTGSPGIGKSDIVRQIADEFGLVLIDHRLSTSSIEDLTGMPRFSTKKGSDAQDHDIAKFVPLNIFPMKWWPVPKGKNGFLLFLDEFNSAEIDIIKAAYKLVLDRKVGLNSLHPSCAIVCAGNRAEDKAIVTEMGTAMKSRMSHFELTVDPEIWYEDVAVPQNYDNRIKAFIQAYPSCLNEFNPDADEDTFSCPRTWEMVDDYLKDALDEMVQANSKIFPEDFYPLISGTLTPRTAANFFTFCKMFDKITPFEDIVNANGNCPLPDEPEMRYASLFSCVERVDDKSLAAVINYINQFPNKDQLLFSQDIIHTKPKICSRKAFANLATQVYDTLDNMGLLDEAA